MPQKLSAGKIGAFFLILTIVASGLLMLSVSKQESAIQDELAHIPAGYSYDKFLDYRLNPEHPPLLKALAAFPLIFMGLNFPLDSVSWTKDVNGQWDTGGSFIYHSNDGRANEIIFWARILPILLTLLFVVLVYIWAKKLMGPIWALLPAIFVGLSPNFLAHGHYVTTDVAAALGFFVGIWTLVNYLNSPNKKSFWIAGIVFGIAQLLKFSTVLLVPLYLFFILIKWWLKSKENSLKLFSNQSLKILWKYFISLVGIFFIGYILVWIVYALFTANYPIDRQVSDTTTILSSFGNGPDPMWSKCPPKGLSMRCLADIDIWMSSSPIFRSIGHYMLGVLMVIQRSAGGNTAYFLGAIGNSGWWYYFPVIFLLKEPLPILIAIALGLGLAIKRYIDNSSLGKKGRFASYLNLNFAEFAMLCTVIFYWLYSIKSTLNIGFRHILPTLPLMYILAAGSIKKWCEHKDEFEYIDLQKKVSQKFKLFLGKTLKYFLLAGLGLWLVVDVAVAYPYFLSFYNGIGGGVWYGYRNVTDSNYDWGQDMLRLKDYIEKNNIQKIAVDYFGGGNIGYYLGDKAIPWNSAKGSPLDQGIDWLAVSINSLQSAKATPEKYFTVESQNTYSWLSNYESPYARAGTSIFIYRLR
jgi:4-amino-4-deoxy-L-arabinose transferase-like glycosyltransferase